MSALAKRALPLPVGELSQHVQTINRMSPVASWSYKVSDKGESELLAAYKFKTFAKTWQFLNGVAFQAHRAKHHPTITTTYNRVDLRLTTHDAGNKVTENDVKLATSIHEIFGKLSSKTPVEADITTFTDVGSTLKEASKIIDDLTKRQ